MTIIVSHPTGNANVRAVLRAAERTHTLEAFFTSVALPASLGEVTLLGARARQELGRRTFAELPWARIRMRPLREAVRLLSPRLGVSGTLARHETGWASIDAVYRHLDRAVARYLASGRTTARAVYAYEDGACDSFRVAHERGLQTIYDLPIAHWRTLKVVLEEERERRPEWASTLDGLQDSPAKQARKDEEIALADRIVVASSFTRKSLTDHFGNSLKIDVTPYGAPPPLVDAPLRRPVGEPLHVLYAGHLRQRKGIAYLFEALQRADFPWRLTLAGPKPSRPCPALERALDDERIRWLGAVPHPVLLNAMTRAHVFVFPSLVEGFGLVLLEAMAAGLPVITTPHTAGPDIVEEGVEGHIVPIRDPDAIADRLATLYDDEDRRFAMATAALAKAVRSGWSGYEDMIAAILAETASC